MMEFWESVGNSGFSMLLKQSGTAFTATLAFHSIGMAFVVGVSGAIALRVLGIAPRIPLAPMEEFWPLMVAGFWISAVTGVLLFVMDAPRFVPDATLYIKMGAIFAAMALAARLRAQVFGQRVDLDAPDELKRARRLATWLLVVWGVAVVSGKVMAYTWVAGYQTSIAVIVCLGLTLLVGRFFLGWGKTAGQSL